MADMRRRALLAHRGRPHSARTLFRRTRILPE